MIYNIGNCQGGGGGDFMGAIYYGTRSNRILLKARHMASKNVLILSLRESVSFILSNNCISYYQKLTSVAIALGMDTAVNDQPSILRDVHY